MSSDQFDPVQIVRIRLKVKDKDDHVWSGRLERRLAEIDVALGSVHLSIEYAKGQYVESAAIVPWRFD